MSTCAQNQSNQDEDGPGADANEGNSHETAAQHFLSTSQSSNGPPSRSNGLPAQPTRGMQVIKNPGNQAKNPCSRIQEINGQIMK